MDAILPPRYVYYEAQTIIADLLRKDNDAKKKLSRIQEGWSSIDCVELEEIDIIQCADIDVRLCDKMMKSKFPLPAMYSYSYGNIIEHVASVNFSVFFDPTTPRQWNNIQKRKYKDKNKYYYFLLDNYLYFPLPKNTDLPVEVVRIKAYFMDKKEVDNFKSLKDCKDCPNEDCKSIMDYEIVLPSYLLDVVKKELINKIASIYLKVQKDEYPDMNNNPSSYNNTKDLQTYGAP